VRRPDVGLPRPKKLWLPPLNHIPEGKNFQEGLDNILIVHYFTCNGLFSEHYGFQARLKKLTRGQKTKFPWLDVCTLGQNIFTSSMISALKFSSGKPRRFPGHHLPCRPVKATWTLIFGNFLESFIYWLSTRFLLMPQ
jgi:hypothetical protein